MTPRAAGLVALAAITTGCIFGGGREKNDPDNNGDTNNGANNGTNNGANNGTNGTNNNDDESYGEATEDLVECEPNPAMFVVPGEIPDTHSLSDDSTVGFTAEQAKIGALDTTYPYAAAWAKVVDGELRVVVGALDNYGTDQPIERAWTASMSIASGAEVRDIWLQGRTVFNTADSVVYVAEVITSEGIASCQFKVQDMNDPWSLRGNCEFGPLQEELEQNRVRAVETFDVLPTTREDRGEHVIEWLSLLVVAAGQGGPEVQRLAAVLYEPLKILDPLAGVDLSLDVDDALDEPERFYTRAAMGVTSEQEGWPSVMAMARARNDDQFEPRILLKAEGDLSYRLADIDWKLASRAVVEPGQFSFLDGYEIQIDGTGRRISHAGSEVMYGYVAAAADEASVIFSRPQAIAGFDFLRLPFEGTIHELRAYRNLPLDNTVSDTGLPFIFVVSGDDRDTLSVLQWDFSADVEILRDVLPDDVTEISGLGFTYLLMDSTGHVAFRARRGGETVLGVFRLADANPSDQFGHMACIDR